MNQDQNLFKNSQIFLLGLCIAFATVAASFIISEGMIKVRKFSTEVITVTGSAERNIVSDSIVWRSEFSRRNPVLTAGYEMLKQDLAVVQSYLAAQGILAAEMTPGPVQTTVIYKKNEKGNDTNDIQEYELRQQIEIRSSRVDEVRVIANASTELIEKGIQFISQVPEFFYMKLPELKVEMLAKATENAKDRALHMVQATGSKISFMRSARMGVFQITPVNSFEVSDWGTNDTSSFEKKVTAVVNVSFGIV